MSKFFYRGTPDVMGKYGSKGYAPKPNLKVGSAANPLSLVVTSDERKLAIEEVLVGHQLIATIEVDVEGEENITELDVALAIPKTQRFDKVPERNAPCSCGSGKKYKKCCG